LNNRKLNWQVEEADGDPDCDLFGGCFKVMELDDRTDKVYLKNF